MKTITLNGIEFSVHRSKYAKVENLERYAHRWLTDCYANPSKSKKEIFKDWSEWAYLNDVEYFGVSSYNTFGFSLQGLIQHLGHTYVLSITPKSNKAYIID